MESKELTEYSKKEEDDPRRHKSRCIYLNEARRC